MRTGLFIAGCLAVTMPSIAPAAQEGGVRASSQAAPDPAFVGHYYLSGIMETGSELLLRADGSFEWYISYGALDQFSHGRWHREGETIVLAARLPSRDKPMFGYLDTQPWSAEAAAAAQGPGERPGGLAVRVIDPRSGETAHGVTAALRFADGSQAEVTTTGSGPTVVADVPDADLVSVRLSAPYAPGRDVDLRIPPVRSGEVRFSIDVEQFTASPFERMILQIDGDTLLPVELGRGRYAR
ncbi:hypothetical protein [Novosphingobium sp.]|uniref:hypothetical protein n=1 Tax=Novosphingobium sp. TaxID=1874826 RepID=UPI0028AF76D7|nr:hypothetical protein [Novosphingobium sp.]